MNQDKKDIFNAITLINETKSVNDHYASIRNIDPADTNDLYNEISSKAKMILANNDEPTDQKIDEFFELYAAFGQKIQNFYNSQANNDPENKPKLLKQELSL